MIQIKLFETEIEANVWLGKKSYVKNIEILDIKFHSPRKIMVIYEILPKEEVIKNPVTTLEKIKAGLGLDPLPQMD